MDDEIRQDIRKIHCFLLFALIIFSLPMLLDFIAGQIASARQKKLISRYEVSFPEQDETFLKEAEEWNRRIRENGIDWNHTVHQPIPAGSIPECIGYLAVPKTGCRLPVFYGTDDSTMKTFAGCLKEMSFPTGTPGTHSLLAAHRETDSFKGPFAELWRLEEGDIFEIHISGHTDHYRIVWIRIVKLDDLSNLCIVPDEALCTLMTCSPKGSTAKRLLVTGKKISEKEYVTMLKGDANRLDRWSAALALFVSGSIAMLILSLVSDFGWDTYRDIRMAEEEEMNWIKKEFFALHFPYGGKVCAPYENFAKTVNPSY